MRYHKFMATERETISAIEESVSLPTLKKCYFDTHASDRIGLLDWVLENGIIN